MATGLQRIPIVWNEQGSVRAWATGEQGKLRSKDGKIPLRWKTENGGRVLLWAYTLPSEKMEIVHWEKLTDKQRVCSFVGSYALAPPLDSELNYQLGAIAREDAELRRTVSLADELKSINAWLRGDSDKWGQKPPTEEISKLTAADMGGIRKSCSDILMLLGTRLANWIADRNPAPFDALARIMKEGRNKCLIQDLGGWWEWGANCDADKFDGTVYRCWLVLQVLGKLSEGVPSKAAFRAYVLQEWEAMGGAITTVDTKFSQAIKTLGLSTLPNGARGRSAVTVRRKATLQK